MTSSFKVYYDMFNPNAVVDFASSSWPMIISIILTIFGAWMFFYHHNKIGKISSLIVPFMALAYFLLAVIAVLMNFDKIPSIVHMILKSAFDFKDIFCGFAGSDLVIGIKRGFFQMKQVYVQPLTLLQ